MLILYIVLGLAGLIGLGLAVFGTVNSKDPSFALFTLLFLFGTLLFPLTAYRLIFRRKDLATSLESINELI